MGDLVDATVVVVKKTNVIWLPPQTIRTFGGRKFVVVQDGDVQRRVDVKLGVVGEDRVEILEGLNEGQVVVSPWGNLRITFLSIKVITVVPVGSTLDGKSFFLFRAWAAIIMAVKRLLAQWELALVTILGLVASISLVITIPLYADAVNHRIFLEKVTGDTGSQNTGKPTELPLTFMFYYYGSIEQRNGKALSHSTNMSLR